MRIRHIFALLTFWAALTGAGGVWANADQGFENAWKICPAAVGAEERRQAIPRHLLGAISEAESGRWHQEKQANIAWPWTVTSGGAGKFFATKAEAVAEVEFLMTRGVRNIDVGCMQINLAAHADAFPSISVAFDPAANAAYGAKYLKAMHARAGNWLTAAGHYHSTTPHLSAKYLAKITRIWNERRGRPAPPLAATPATPGAPEIARKRSAAEIDHARLAQLNRNFQARQGLAKPDAAADPASRRVQHRQSEIATWRDAQSRGQDLGVLLAKRQAEVAKRRKRQLISFGQADRMALFAERRRQQMNDWRSRRLVPFPKADTAEP